ncbi:hypothetical protein N9743_01410 [Flavobacteriaceae bacterium]|nr:hypothetical protein [Flavobacteriaceae bacterium]
MRKIVIYLVLITSHLSFSQFTKESLGEEVVDFEGVVVDVSIVQKKQNLLSKINESLIGLTQIKKEELEKIEKNKEKLGSTYDSKWEYDYLENKIQTKTLTYYSLLYIIEFSETLYVDIEWYKGFMSLCKLVLIDENGVKYGGTQWTGISLSFNTVFNCKKNQKIKNKKLKESIIGGSLVVGSDSDRTGKLLDLTSDNYNREFTPQWFIYEHLKKYEKNEKGYIDYKFGDF